MEKIVGRWNPQLKKFFTKGEGLNCRSCICIIWNYSTDKTNVYPSQGNNTAFRSIVSFCCVGEPFCKMFSPSYVQLCTPVCTYVCARSVCHKIKEKKFLMWKGKMKSLFLTQKEEGFLQGGKPSSISLGMALISRANVQHCISSPGKRVCKPPSRELHPSHTSAKELK